MTPLVTGAALLALAASPMRVVVHPGETTSVALRNVGAAGAVVSAAPAAYRLDLRGRPLIGGALRGWLAARPGRLVLAPGRSARVEVRASAPVGSRPGDHARVLLFAATAAAPHGLRLSVRVGVVVVVRCAGRLRRSLVPGELRVVRSRGGRVLRLVLMNRGNGDEWIGARRVVVRLARQGRVLAVLRARPRRVLAGTVGVFSWRLPPRMAGELRATASVEGGRVRRYRLRL